MDPRTVALTVQVERTAEHFVQVRAGYVQRYGLQPGVSKCRLQSFNGFSAPPEREK